MSSSSNNNTNNQPPPLLLRPLSDSEIPMAAKIIAKAFEDSVIYSYIFKDITNKENKLQALEWFFERRLLIAKVYDGLILGAFHSVDNSLLSTLTLASTESQSPSWWVKLRYGFILFPIYYGVNAVLRAIEIGDEVTRISYEAHGNTDYELMMVVTRPDYQGQGIGSKLLKYALTEELLKISKKKNKICIIGLSTQKESNRLLYEKFGFKVTSQKEMLQDKPDRYLNYSMMLKIE
jgi:ribosomal protein S18 acetylase RimI-like enzyme